MVRHLKSRADASSSSPASAPSTTDVSAIVKGVIDTIRSDGDAAVRSYSEKFDKWGPASFKLSSAEIEAAIAACPEQTLRDIKEVQGNIRAFAVAQRESLRDFEIEIQPGVHLGRETSRLIRLERTSTRSIHHSLLPAAALLFMFITFCFVVLASFSFVYELKVLMSLHPP